MDKQREAFEAWWKSNRHHSGLIRFNAGAGKGDYMNASAIASWQAWQACAQQYEAEIAALRAEASKLTDFMSKTYMRRTWGVSAVDVAIEILSDLDSIRADAIKDAIVKVKSHDFKDTWAFLYGDLLDYANKLEQSK